MTWTQNYDPLHFWPLSTLVAAVPVFTLFFVLLVLRARVWVAAMAGMADGDRAGPGDLRHAGVDDRRVRARWASSSGFSGSPGSSSRRSSFTRSPSRRASFR